METERQGVPSTWEGWEDWEEVPEADLAVQEPPGDVATLDAPDEVDDALAPDDADDDADVDAHEDAHEDADEVVVVPDPELERLEAERRLADVRSIRKVVSLLTVAAATLFTLVQVHPEKILRRNTPTGGDMGAHVWAPAFLRDHLLPNFRLQGWSMDWYAGLPVYRFYMLPPALLMTVLNGVLQFPYGVAFKIVAVLGVVTLPLNCWAYGRLSRLAWPLPELLAIGAVLFLFDENFTIYGGNIPSTMAGEFSFSIALSLAMLGLGLLNRGMREGRGLGMAAAVLALAAVCHGIVAIFVAAGSIVMVLLWADFRDRRRLLWGAATLGMLGLLTAWWILPFKLTTQYMTNMKYEPFTGDTKPWWDFFNPQSPQMTLFLLTFATIGFVACVVRGNRGGAFLGVTCLLWVALVYLAQDPLPFVGDLFWNYRGLPFVYLTRYLLAMIGIGETIRFVLRYVVMSRNERLAGVPTGSAVWARLQRRARPDRVALETTMVQFAAVAVVGVLMIGWIAFGIDRLPGQRQVYENGEWKHKWGFIEGRIVDDGADSDGWSSYNFSGYEGRETWNEHRALLDTSKRLGAGRGCGRALWEHQPDTNYGTPMALMLLPFWTDGCIGSTEGLFFEASGTTPYHFLAASAASENASDPVRELRYDRTDLDIGVPYLRELGVRYYYAFSREMVAQAAEREDLVEVAVSGPWHIYEVQGWALVTPLDAEPVVVRGRGGDARERWLEVGLSWFQNPEEWSGLLVADGPSDWQRVTVRPDPARTDDRRVDVLQATTPYDARPLEPFAFDPTTVELGQSSISFDVPPEAIGHPMLVRVSYFPNWKVSGAQGPYRAAPNFMVVVPTSTHVELRYGYSALDLGSYGLTLVGIGLLLFFWRGRRIDFADAPAE